MWTLLSLVTLAVVVEAEDGEAQYQFSYHVKDQTTGQDFGQEEERQGYNTGGEYQVNLPDGRRQVVTYSVIDPNSGYVADVTYHGEAQYDQVADQQELGASQQIIIPALPPIRNKPSLPRTEKILQPKRPQEPSPEEIRFISRPTKIVPTIIKLPQTVQSSPITANTRHPKRIVGNVQKVDKTNSPKLSSSSPDSANIKKPITRVQTVPKTNTSKATLVSSDSSKINKPITKVKTVPKTSSPKVSNLSSDSPNIKKPITKVQTVPKTNSPRAPKSSANSIDIKKPISAFKSVPSTTTTPAPPPVYISSKPPKLSYKGKYHTAETQVLYSLFREDVKDKKMEPPSKEQE